MVYNIFRKPHRLWISNPTHFEHEFDEQYLNYHQTTSDQNAPLLKNQATISILNISEDKLDSLRKGNMIAISAW